MVVYATSGPPPEPCSLRDDRLVREEARDDQEKAEESGYDPDATPIRWSGERPDRPGRFRPCGQRRVLAEGDRRAIRPEMHAVVETIEVRGSNDQENREQGDAKEIG